MDDYKKQIKNELNEVNNALEYIRKMEQNEPEGSLRISRRKDSARYYQRVRKNKSEEFTERYLPKDQNESIIQQLIQKQYLHSLKPILEQEADILTRIQHSYNPEKKGKVIYWEHAGMLDNPEYAEDFVEKLNAYMKEGYTVGVDLIVTFETSKIPLDISLVKTLIKEKLLS